MNQLIGKIKKNTLEHLCIELTEYNGHDLVALRVYRFVDGADARIPTPKGVTVNVRLLPQIRELLDQAEAEARKAGLL